VYLDLELCDRNQKVLTRLDNRRAGARIEIGLNGADRRGYCPLSLEDPAYDQAAAVETILRATLKGGPEDRTLLNGRVIIPEQGEGESGEALGLNAVGPMFQLDRALIRKVSGSTWEAVTFAAKDQSQIMWSLIETATTHGVIKGSLPASVNRDRTYVPGKEVGPAMVEMSEVINGPDFEFEPVRASDGTLARFNTFHPRKGEDKSDEVVFVIGAPPYTASAFTFAPGGDEIVNRVLVIGAPLNNEGEEEQPYATFPAYVAEHAASIAKYGVFEQVVQLEDVVEVSTMKAHAEAFVAANAYPIPYFDFTSAFEPLFDEKGAGIPPAYGVDYEVGDTVGVHAYLGGAKLNDQDLPVDEQGDLIEPLELAGRITDVVITETESGLLQVKATCSPEVKAEGVSGQSVTLKVPEVVE
jgi:hypothetical protein